MTPENQNSEIQLKLSAEDLAQPEKAAEKINATVAVISARAKRAKLKEIKARNRNKLRDSFINAMGRKATRHQTIDELHEIGLIANAIEWRRKVE